ncbi:MAG TPA: hypothetical protein VK203_17145 [Nostocaceae cyanobacterium]|nr:hypothetical protein [Nostocaceae cyanobacterium]
MNKILCSLVSIGLVVGTPSIANADAAYNRFRKNQIAEFTGDKAPKNCQEKKLKLTESGNQVLYELCAVKGKPIYLKSSIDGVTYGYYEFKNSKLVQSAAPDAGVSIGFRNEQPVVRWDWFNETVTWKIDADTKTTLRENTATIKRILNRFGIRTS